MTREEAIKAMTKYMPKGNDSVSLMLREAMNMGIKALEQITDLKDAYDKGYKDGQEALALHYKLCKEEGSIIAIPDGATNGDMIKALFPDAEIIFKDGFYETTVDWHTKTHRCHLFDNDWWNSPYRKEKI